MLGEVFIRKVARDAMAKYAAEHGGKSGVAKADIIRIVMDMGGDMDDVRAVMVECVQDIMPETCDYIGA